MALATAPENLARYLAARHSGARSETLAAAAAARERWPVAVVRDLLSVPQEPDQAASLLALADAREGSAYERFLIDGLAIWDPTTAFRAVRDWIDRSDRLLSARLAAVAADPAITSQRLRFALLERCGEAGGAPMLAACLAFEDPALAAGAFQGLVLVRAAQLGNQDPRLGKLAESLALETGTFTVPASPALHGALTWLAQFHPDTVIDLFRNPLPTGTWTEVLRALLASLDHEAASERLKKALARPSRDHAVFHERVAAAWPPCWVRGRVDQEFLQKSLVALLRRPLPQTMSPPPTQPLSWETLCSIPPKTLVSVLEELEGDAFLAALPHVEPLLPTPWPPALKSRVATTVAALGKPCVASGTAARLASHAEARPNALASESVPTWWLAAAGTRDSWFGVRRALRICAGSAGAAPSEALLTNAFALASEEPTIFGDLVDVLERRRDPGLGVRLAGNLGNPDFSIDRRIDLCRVLARFDGGPLQTAVRAALAPLARREALPPADRELREALQRLALPLHVPQVPEGGKDGAVAEQAVLEFLRRGLPSYDHLDPLSARHLRTARWVEQAALSAPRHADIDASPAVDLQYRAAETRFGVVFEPACVVLGTSSEVRAALDRLGYVRGARESTDAFESYLAALPGIAEIPYFSRYKLNRLLRGLALHQKHRQFTFDGLKAYALFFLCFARRTCPFGLAGLLPLPFADDRDLAEYCRALHEFQDLRNRIVHEAERVDVPQRLEQAWNTTFALLGRVPALGVSLPQAAPTASSMQGVSA